ncbi:MAG: glycosyltransferase, partial [Actinomycetota bacterium]
YNLPGNITDAKRKVVAVSQGTVDKTDTSKLIEPTLAALRDGPYVVVATTGGSRTEELRTRYSAPNVVIEDFIDYDVLFPHVDLFVTNGGYGSILEAMCHGVPVVSAGTREGKNDNNARIQHNRLGIDLRTERPKARQVAAAVTKALTDPAIRRKVDRLRDELASYEPVTIIERALLDLASAPPRGGRGVGVT